jgi:hypothetical protein
MIKQDKHICETLMEYVEFLGVTKIDALPGLWESKVDDHWTVKCNGHSFDIDSVPGFSWYIEYNGWPAGVISVLGDGFLCAGEAGNEEHLRIGLEAAMINTVK